MFVPLFTLNTWIKIVFKPNILFISSSNFWGENLISLHWLWCIFFFIFNGAHTHELTRNRQFLPRQRVEKDEMGQVGKRKTRLGQLESWQTKKERGSRISVKKIPGTEPKSKKESKRGIFEVSNWQFYFRNTGSVCVTSRGQGENVRLPIKAALYRKYIFTPS